MWLNTPESGLINLATVARIDTDHFSDGTLQRHSVRIFFSEHPSENYITLCYMESREAARAIVARIAAEISQRGHYLDLTGLKTSHTEDTAP